MAVTDYNRAKTLEASSFNDSGATIDKAQAVELVGNNYTGFDGFENGSSQLNWESNSNINIDTNGEVYGNNSLRFNSVGDFFGLSKTLNTAIAISNKTLVFSVKIDNKTGDPNDNFTIEFQDGTVELGDIEFLGNGDLEDGQNNTLLTWNTGQTYDIEVVFSFVNQTYDVLVNGTTESSNVPFNNTRAEVNSLNITLDSSNSGQTVNAFIDRLTYTSEADQTVNSGGVVPIDDSNVAGPSDIAFYDTNDNLLGYEIENDEDITSSGLNGSVFFWVYDSYVRDDSGQVQVVYGDSPTSSEEGTAADVWGNPGQNAVMVQHLNRNATDSTSNNNDGTITGAVEANGQFAEGYDFDGVDDIILVDDSSSLDITGDITAVIWSNADTWQGNARIFHKYDFGSEAGYTFYNSGGIQVRWIVGDGSNRNDVRTSSNPSTGEWHHYAGTVNGGTQEFWIDASSIGTNTGISTSTNNNNLGIHNQEGRGSGDGAHDGTGDEARLYSDGKSSAWIQADYDASPKAGQVFFTQQAAEPTAGATISIPVSENQSITPAPTLQAGNVNLNLPESTNSSVTPAPTIQPGNVNIGLPISTNQSVTPAPTIFSGQTINLPVSENQSITPAPNLQAGNANLNLPVSENQSITPAPTIRSVITINLPASQNQSVTPAIQVTPGNADITLPASTNQSITPSPTLQPGNANISLPASTNQSVTPPFTIQATATVNIPVSENQSITPAPRFITPGPGLTPPLKFIENDMTKYFKTENSD